MESTTSTLINIVVWAESREDASKIATALTSGSETQDGVFVGTHNATSVTAYLRYPGGEATSAPQGITDILIVSVSGSSSQHLTDASSYVNLRKGIPFKFFTSSEDLTEVAKSLTAEFLPYSDVTSSETREKLISSVNNLEATLVNAFNALDLNKNGFITAEELVQASSTLGHTLNHEESKIIANTLSTDGNISFGKFKQWWIMGRGDFNTFRRLVAVELSVGNLIKKSSQVFNDYVEKLTKETEGANDVSYVGRINLGPTTPDFETGFGVDVDLAGGKDFENILSVSPDYFKTSPITYGLEIKVKDDQAGALIKQTLEGLREMANMIPQAQEVFNLGLTVNVRHVGTSVFVDFSLGGVLADQVLQSISQFNFEQLNFAGTGSFSAFTGLRLSDLLTGTVEDLINRVTLFKVESHSEFSNTKNLAYALSSVYTQFKHQVPHKMRPFIGLIKLFGAIRNFSYEFTYDSDEFAKTVKEVLGAFGGKMLGSSEEMSSDVVVQGLNSQLQGFQGMGLGMIGQFKPMLDGFLESFKPSLQQVNFDRISMFTSIPKMKMYYKASLHLPGVSAFLLENILN
jgi:hypothetical protein